MIRTVASSSSAVHHDWSVLRLPLFAALWTSALVSHTGTLMQEVGVAWLMTSLDPSPLTVALIQTAETLPYFLLALPAGALADILDRRRLALFSQIWMFVVAFVLGVITLHGVMTPVWLLMLTALLGLGNALSGPVYQAIIPELVPVTRLSSAITLNSASFNLARTIGPAIGGLLVAAAGAGTTFLVNAVSFLGVIVVLYRWQRPSTATVARSERLAGAIRAGMQYVWHQDRLWAVLVRCGAFSLGASAFWALIPLVARFELDLSAAGYGLLLACFGIGAVAITAFLPVARQQLSQERLVQLSTLIFAGSLLVVGTSRHVPIVAAALLLAGGMWLSILTTFNTMVQITAAEWVRGRALAIYFMVFFGTMAAGSALWGWVAQAIGVDGALAGAAGAVLLTMGMGLRYPLREADAPQLPPSRDWPALAATLNGSAVPVFVSIEYVISPRTASGFIDAMHALRTIRLRQGAVRWELLNDATHPERYVETFLIDAWNEHMHHHDRMTMADREAEQRVLAFHTGPQPPRANHFLAVANTTRRSERHGRRFRLRQAPATAQDRHEDDAASKIMPANVPSGDS